MTEPQTSMSPPWGTNTKLVIALTIVVIFGALLVKFQSIITPLLLAFMLAYLFHPIASFLKQKAHFSWGLAVSIIYLVIVALLLAGLTAGGVGLVQQIQNLITGLQNVITDLPQLIENASSRTYEFGPFELDFRALDLSTISSQVLGMIQPLLSQTGTLLGTVAGGAANFVGWTFFVILISYFILAESGGLRGQIVPLDFPGYTRDFERLARELGRIWNAFLRGQIIMFLLAITVYSITFGILGVHYAIGMAFVAGLARFVPYAGQGVTWTVLVLISYFQTFKLFGLSPLHYTLVVMGFTFVIDQVFDNIVSPRILSDALKVHPAAVLVAAIIAASLFGLLGVVVAAPILATTILFWKYVMRKMLDLNPWTEEEIRQPPAPPASRFLVAARRFLRRFNSNPKGKK